MAGMGSCSWVALAFALVVAPLGALAQPGATPPPAEQPETETHHYGTLIVAADLLVAATGLITGRGEAVLALAFTGPVVHIAHGRFGAAGGSLLLRTLVPIGGAYLGAATCGSDDVDCIGPALAGFAFGAVFALGTDYLVLAKKTTVVQRPGRLQPSVLITPRASTVGLRVAF
jgi:hypothetical protein